MHAQHRTSILTQLLPTAFHIDDNVVAAVTPPLRSTIIQPLEISIDRFGMANSERTGNRHELKR